MTLLTPRAMDGFPLLELHYDGAQDIAPGSPRLEPLAQPLVGARRAALSAIGDLAQGAATSRNAVFPASPSVPTCRLAILLAIATDDRLELDRRLHRTFRHRR